MEDVLAGDCVLKHTQAKGKCRNHRRGGAGVFRKIEKNTNDTSHLSSPK
jgi:hypothetical protein